MSSELNDLVTFTQGVYWISLDVALAVCGLWVFLFLYLLFHLDARLERVVCIGNLGWIAWLLLPYVGSLCFVPLASVLLDVLACDKAVGTDSLTFADSVLSRDCYVHCWQGSHIYYTAAALLGLLVFVPFSVFLRPLWQEFQPQLHIKTSSSHFLVKSIFQLLIILLRKTLYRESPLAHEITFLSLVLGFFLFQLKYRGFNYARVTHWHRLSLLGVLWLSLLTLLANRLSVSPSYWALAALVGLTGIVVFGWVWMRLHYPSLLVRERGVDTQRLFKFAFQFKESAANSEMVGVLNSRVRTSGILPTIEIIIPDNL